MARKRSQAQQAIQDALYLKRAKRRAKLAAQQRLDSPREWVNHDPNGAGLLAAGIKLGYTRHNKEFNEYRDLSRARKRRGGIAKITRTVRHPRIWVDAIDGTR